MIHTDAKSIASTTVYDALNRPVSTSYADSTLNVTYAYDDANSVTGCSASSPIGRLTRVIEKTVTTVYCYDPRGNITRKQQVLGTTTDTTIYAYTSADRLSTLTDPDGSVIAYGHDSVGRVNSVTVTPVGGSAATAVSNVSYRPFGPISSYTLGNGQVITRAYDANYTLSDLTSTALNLHFARDLMGNIIAEGNSAGASPAVESYGYDPLYRLKSVTEGSTVMQSFTYNATGDRTSKAGNGLATGTYGYKTNTHWLTSIGSAARTYDANGDTTASVSGGKSFGYGFNGRNRMALVQIGGTTVGTYTYNVMGQRIQKVVTLPSAATVRFAYDEQNHVIGEYTSANKRDTVWLDDLPVATLDVAGSTRTLNYITADHMGTPRVVTNSAGATIWSWPYVGNAFGELAPTSTGGYTLNLRFPGQYYDAESGVNYNLNRYYEPATGRYLQSDSIGLGGGWSTYAYTKSNPLGYYDPSGKFIPEAIFGAVIGGAFGGITGYIAGDRGTLLAEDAIAGTAAGALIGLTGGLSLATDAAVDAGLKVALSAGIGAGSEALRQYSNYGCIKSYGDIALAGGFGVAGIGAGGSVLGALGLKEIEGVSSYGIAGIAGISTGAVQTQISVNEAEEDKEASEAKNSNGCGCN